MSETWSMVYGDTMALLNEDCCWRVEDAAGEIRAQCWDEEDARTIVEAQTRLESALTLIREIAEGKAGNPQKAAADWLKELQ
jgi:hypothetical protein